MIVVAPAGGWAARRRGSVPPVEPSSCERAITVDAGGRHAGT